MRGAKRRAIFFRREARSGIAAVIAKKVSLSIYIYPEAVGFWTKNIYRPGPSWELGFFVFLFIGRGPSWGLGLLVLASFFSKKYYLVSLMISDVDTYSMFKLLWICVIWFSKTFKLWCIWMILKFKKKNKSIR